MTRWWVRKLNETISADEGKQARAASIAALADTESLRNRVDSVSGSISVQNTRNHYAGRIEKSYVRHFGVDPERP